MKMKRLTMVIHTTNDEPARVIFNSITVWRHSSHSMQTNIPQACETTGSIILKRNLARWFKSLTGFKWSTMDFNDCLLHDGLLGCNAVWTNG
jgi:hypothetical protein